MPEASASLPAPVAPAEALARWPEPDWITRAADHYGWSWARIQWARAASQPGAWFDAPKADKVVANWPKWFRLTSGGFYGQPFDLLLWQECVVRLLVGWKIPADPDSLRRPGAKKWVRLYREFHLWMPRKGGKTEFMSALTLLFYVFERQQRKEGYVFAAKEKQGKLAFDKMAAMVGASPVFGTLEVFKTAIFVPELSGSIELLPGSAAGAHGKNPSVIFGDEMHEWKSPELRDTLRQGMGTQLEPIGLYASTAGMKTNQTGVDLYEDSQKILDGRTDQPSTLVAIFAAAPDDDPFDALTWKKANPSLGISPTLRFMQQEAGLAAGNPRKTVHFACYHCGIWGDADVKWLPMSKWDACADDKKAWARFPDELKGRKCFVGLDLSKSRDITALVLQFPPEEPGEKTKLVCKFWIPDGTFAEREATSNQPWRKWRDAGALITTPGDAVDQGYVLQELLNIVRLYDVQKIAFDGWNTTKIMGDLQKEDAFDFEIMVQMIQGIRTFAGPSIEFETKVFNGSLDHGGHPILRWMAGNTICRFDENLNFMPGKKRSADKIDGIVAAVMSIGVAMTPDDTEYFDTSYTSYTK